MKKILLICATGVLAFAMPSCKKNYGKHDKKISQYNQTESHHAGENCMSCHSQGGGGEGWFEIAGTVYDTSYSSIIENATIRLYTGINGTGDLKYTIEGDKKGNFFTTKSVDFGNGLYPVVSGPTISNHMSTPITTGACNSCHGVSTDRIWVY